MNHIVPIETSADLQLHTDESAILANLERIEDTLAKIVNHAELLLFRNQAKLIQNTAAHRNLINIQVRASVLVIRAEIALSKCYVPMDKNDKGYLTLRAQAEKNGISYSLIMALRNVYSPFPDVMIETEIQNAIQTKTALTRSHFELMLNRKRRANKRGAGYPPDPEICDACCEREIREKAWQSTKTGNPERYTNPAIIERVHAVFGQVPDLDPFSCTEANTVVKAKKIYTQADDGLSQKWHGKTFVSPPFDSETITAAVEKLVDSYFKGHVTEAILLTESLSQPNWYMHAKIACDVEFIHTKNGGRFTYWTPEGKAHKGMSRGYLFYFGDTPTKFAESFSDIGKCYIQYKR